MCVVEAYSFNADMWSVRVKACPRIKEWRSSGVLAHSYSPTPEYSKVHFYSDTVSKSY